MRIVQLTPGTGNFYCGSCLRDHALAKALRALGHEIIIVPLYLPMVVEEEDPAQPVGPLFLGGINMYLQLKSAFFRRTPRWLDRFFDRESLLRKVVSRSNMTSPRELGELTVECLLGGGGRQKKEVAKLIDWLKTQPKPDIVVFSNGLLVGVAAAVKEALGTPVVCTLQGEDSFLDTLPEPYRERAWDLFREKGAEIARFVAVSEYHAGVMRQRLRMGSEKIASVLNGIDFTGLVADPEKRVEPPIIGYLARMCMGKGLHTLVDAFIDLRQRTTVEARLHLAGAMTAVDHDFVESQRKKLADAGFAEDVEFTPNLKAEQKNEFLQRLSVLSVPACYGESFGLYVIEALACEVPVVQPNHGAFPEILGKCGGGVLCDPDDPTSLADSLEIMLTLEDRRRKLGHEGGLKARQYFTSERMAKEVAAIWDDVLSPH